MLHSNKSSPGQYNVNYNSIYRKVPTIDFSKSRMKEMYSNVRSVKGSKSDVELNRKDVDEGKICEKYKLFLEKYGNKEEIINNYTVKRSPKLRPIIKKSKSCIDLMN